MSHRAALYRVQIRPRNKVRDWRLFGDYDEAGSWLGSAIKQALENQTTYNQDRTLETNFGEVLPNLPPNSFGIEVLSGRAGVNSVFIRDGVRRFVRSIEDSEVMRSAVLFYLPPHKTEGWLIVYVPHRRGCKTSVYDALRKRFRRDGFVIEVAPFVPQDALRDLIGRTRISKITLIKRELTRADRFSEAAQWGNKEVERIELTFRGRRLKSLNSAPIRRFLNDKSEESKKRIVEFGGLPFEDAAITMAMPQGGQRTFYLEAHEGGHPLTVGLELQTAQTDEYGVNLTDLSSELQRVLQELDQTLTR